MDAATQAVWEANREIQQMVLDLANELGLPHAESQSVDRVLVALRDYTKELEWIVYCNVNLSGIMLNGHSEATYNRINAKYDTQATPPAGEP